MADSTVNFFAEQKDYIAQLNTLVAFAELWATEVEAARNGESTLLDALLAIDTKADDVTSEVTAAREGEASLLANLTAIRALIADRVAKAGLDANLPFGGFRGTGAADGVDPNDLTTLQQVNALILGGGNPGDIDITALAVGALAAGEILFNNAGSLDGFAVTQGSVLTLISGALANVTVPAGGLLGANSSGLKAITASDADYLFGA